MKLKNVKFKFTGGVDCGRGWKGDVKNMLLDIKKLKSIGWKPELNSKQAIRKSTRQLLNESRLRKHHARAFDQAYDKVPSLTRIKPETI